MITFIIKLKLYRKINKNEKIRNKLKKQPKDVQKNIQIAENKLVIINSKRKMHYKEGS